MTAHPGIASARPKGPLTSPSKPKRKRTYNLRLIKATWPYTIEEIAELFDINKNAVSIWMDNGLQANRSQRPILIRGDDLATFLGERQARRRCQCDLARYYCFRCREPRPGYLGIVDLEICSATKVRMTSVCEACGTAVAKFQSVASLPEIHMRLNVQELRGAHLLERAALCLNRGWEKHP